MGLTPSDEALLYIEHASRCSHCGPLLREAVAECADLDRELTAEERERIASLESARAEWQERIAGQIAGTPQPPVDRRSEAWWRKWLAVPRLAMATAAIIAVVGAGLWVALHQTPSYQGWFHHDQRAAAAELLARAYTEKRTLELRIAGAEYAPMHITRGPTASFKENPKDLLAAEALIASQPEAQANSAPWLQAQAEADLLEGKYEPAVEALRRSSELEPNSAPILTDLATAYFQRALEKDRKDDFGTAYEYLSQALKQSPDDPVALFNRAIVSEHQFLYHQALDDWDHYLRVDPGSKWAEDARKRADILRAKLNEHSNRPALLTPAQLAALGGVASPPSEADKAAVDQRVGEYLDQAVRSWLPQAFPAFGTNEPRTKETESEASAQASRALFFLADLTSQRHVDLWLADLLRGSAGPHFAQAVAALARAFAANQQGGYDAAREPAALAERLFRTSGNKAGVLRAQFEQAYAEQLARRSEDCRQRATSALAESKRYSYPWLQVQLGFEKSVCSGLMGDFGVRRKAAQDAVQRAQETHYWALYLRALGAAADDEFIAGDPSGGSKVVIAGLEIYWSGQFAPVRGYSLYTELAVHASNIGRSNLQLAILREAVALVDSDENWVLRAVAHKGLANAAMAADLPQVAEREYAEAARLYATLPPTEAIRNSALEMEVRAAQLEARLGQPDDAIARLTAIQDQIGPLSNNYLVQMFYTILGELQLSRHRAVEAEQALRPALALTEQSLTTLKSEVERTNWSKTAAATYLALVEAELVQGRQQEALDSYEWYLGAPQRAGSSPHLQRPISDPPMPEPSRLASIRQGPESETVVAYAILPDGLAIWVHDETGINASWKEQPTESLRELAERFQDLSSDPKSDMSALRRDAGSLYEALIAPVEQHITPGRTLMIEANDWLSRVPFEGLLDANGHYLIERTPIVYSLGQFSHARLHGGPGITANSAALVVGSAASSREEGLIPFPDASAEANAVAGGFRKVRLLEGREATLSAVLNDLPGAAIFHFSGHALATSGRTGLMLESENEEDTSPRLMDADAVRQLPLTSLQLAVLSACSTASSEGGSSEFESITGAFLRAGVPHVVASRWAVDSAETQRFVQDFYRNALLGQTVPAAIRLTSLKMMADPVTSHPYYWSALAAYGRP
ncbi:MAG: CHAT domain-containing protein [Terriglobales bacterium]